MLKAYAVALVLTTTPVDGKAEGLHAVDLQEVAKTQLTKPKGKTSTTWTLSTGKGKKKR